MKFKFRHFLLLIAVACIYSVNVQACGKERWPVKVGTDRDAVFVSGHPVDTNIAKLVALPAPINPNIRRDTRYQPIETSVYRISGHLIMIKREKDKDFHLVVKDNRNRTMILEVPSVECAMGSRFIEQIKQVRNQLNKRYHIHVRKKLVINDDITVTGIGFFDKIHGQEGVAPNGIELHPLLSITYKAE